MFSPGSAVLLSCSFCTVSLDIVAFGKLFLLYVSRTVDRTTTIWNHLCIMDLCRIGSSLIGFLGGHVPASSWDILLPVGISFYTFQTLFYVIDVYRKDLPHETHFGYYALFVSFFPQLVAGPIERPGSLLPQLKQEYTFQIEDLRHGFRQILIGFFKKIVVADYLAGFADAVFATPGKAVCRPCIQAIFCKRTDCYTYPETDRDAHACMLCMDFFPCTDAF